MGPAVQFSGNSKADFWARAGKWACILELDRVHPRAMLGVTLLLIGRDYTSEAIRQVVDHVTRTGNPQGCPWVDEAEVPLIEEAIYGSPINVHPTA